MERKYVRRRKNLIAKLIKLIKLFVSWNDNEVTNEEKKIIWVRLPYLGHVGGEMRKRCFKKVHKRLTEKVCCFTRYEMKNLAMTFIAK